MDTDKHVLEEEASQDDQEDEEDDEELSQPDQEMEDLFGDDKEVDEVKHEDVTTPGSSEHADGISSPERKHRAEMEYGEDDEPDPVVEEVLEASAQIPNIPVPRSTDGSLWVIRMPNFVKVDSKPFHPETYIGPEQEDDDAQPGETLREKSMSIKLKVENTVRWRWTKDENGRDRRQSNSRVIRWSDGSLSLQLGKELFDITQTVDTSGAVGRQALGGTQLPAQSQSQSQSLSQSQTAGAKAQGLTYLVAQHKRAEILQCEGIIKGTMTLRPTGMQSETHRMLVRAVGQKHSKIARLRMAPDPTTDPEREKMELLKQAAKKPKKSNRDEDGLGGGGKRRRASYTRKRPSDDMWSDDDDDVGFGGGSEDEFGLSGSADRKGKKKDESNKRGPGEYQNDDFLVADSEDEDADFVDSDDGARKKKSRRHREEVPEEDDLDRLEAKIEADEKKRRAQEVGDGSNPAGETATANDAMDVESEEDDEDWGVRRAGTGSRKRRAIDFEDEEEE
ncbi:Leo1-like protein-domain-containing protein [Irpex rosettiformis]|uniref:Leo1-like protein-domain-containing protein n=1 Tax=Irpex rosettiformis TaxID=378272 RepID=A0ACB8TQY1_9APHY|nr:Leo1-like protein-domain-containing protein [Irpex rosettiformis]